jgi:uncharacterized membrane protein YeaQ/YmgE (transglycosylase-associated protein family)
MTRTFVALMVTVSNGALVAMIVAGIVSGWLAGRVRGQGFGVVGDLFVGMCGALVGNWFLPRLGVRPGVDIVAHIIDASIGAVILLIMVRFVLDVHGWGTGRR